MQHADDLRTESTTTAATPDRFAWQAPSAVALFLAVAVTGFTLDLWSKYWAFGALQQGGEAWVIIPHVLEFQAMLNPGALFGFGAGRTSLFLVASAFALVLVLWMFIRSHARQWAWHLALGAILAGALGNMYDRITVQLVEQPFNVNQRIVHMEIIGESGDRTLLQEYPAQEGGVVYPVRDDLRLVGFVRDFIKIPTKIYGDRDLWPWVFNVADMLLVGGVILLLLQMWREQAGSRQRQALNDPRASDETQSTDRAAEPMTRDERQPRPHDGEESISRDGADKPLARPQDGLVDEARS